MKIYLVASLQERAHRRHKELALRGIRHEFDEVLADLERRDRHDSTRAVAPLRAAPDAGLVDTTGLSVDEQTARVVAAVRARQSGAAPTGSTEQ